MGRLLEVELFLYLCKPTPTLSLPRERGGCYKISIIFPMCSVHTKNDSRYDQKDDRSCLRNECGHSNSEMTDAKKQAKVRGVKTKGEIVVMFFRHGKGIVPALRIKRYKVRLALPFAYCIVLLYMGFNLEKSDLGFLITCFEYSPSASSIEHLVALRKVGMKIAGRRLNWVRCVDLRFRYQHAHGVMV